jgi:two-component system, OmpR family, response regulator
MRPRVLVVEDEAPLRELVVVTLGREFDCDEAADGETALESVRAAIPAVVVLDSMLPGRSGLDVLRTLRADGELRHVPVLMLSAWQAPADVDAALAAGATRFLGKPFKVEELLETVRSLAEAG